MSLGEKITFKMLIAVRKLTFQPAELLLSPLSLKYGTFCTIQSYTCDNVSRCSGDVWMAFVMRSAYDRLPHALRRDPVFLLFNPSGSTPPSPFSCFMTTRGSRHPMLPRPVPSSMPPPGVEGASGTSCLMNSFGRSGQVLDRARACGSKFGSVSAARSMLNPRNQSFLDGDGKPDTSFGACCSCCWSAIDP